VRISLRVGGAALALLTASLLSFPDSASPKVWFSDTGILTSSRAISVNRVNRALKGDRLPFVDPSLHELGLPAAPARSLSREKIPVGCDAAFSPISSPRLANVFRRCTA